MKSQTLEKLKEALSYDPETGLFTRKNGAKAGTLSHHGYLRMKIDDRTYQAHRLAWLYIHGYMPINSIDHIDGDKLNNRISNLREADRSQNNQNGRASERKHDLPRGVGISHPSGRFKASISLGNKCRHLGTFDTPEGASEFYQLAADMLHGEFAFHRCQGAAIAAAKGQG